MADEFPAVHYHEDGEHRVVHSEAAAKALGKGWGKTPNDKNLAQIRKATGGVAEVILPVTRTQAESV